MKDKRRIKKITKRNRQRTMKVAVTKTKILRPRVKDMDQVYRLLNKVQINKKALSFAVEAENAAMIENITKDLQLTCEKKPYRNKVIFKVFPNLENKVLDLSSIQEFDDEILEEGQLF